MSYKKTLEDSLTATKSKTFNISKCLEIESEIKNKYILSDLSSLKKKFNKKDYKKVLKSVIRFSFFIQSTDPNGESDSANTRVRWADILTSDPRFASYETCERIAQDLFHKLNKLPTVDLDLIKEFMKYASFDNFYLPIDYRYNNKSKMHIRDNVELFIDDTVKKRVAFFKILYDKNLNADIGVFKMAISKKIKTKAYKTDRAQTGNYKTNREPRWEAHPNNPQFAFFRNCEEVEEVLLEQLCRFDNVNVKLVTELQHESILSTPLELMKCPVTGDIFNFEDFSYEIYNQLHGQSNFHVGHMTPLKLGGLHDKNNVSWITGDGNRMQGNLSLDKLDELIVKIIHQRPDLKAKI